MREFVFELRASARAALPERAQLRRARGEFLFFTNANCADALNARGFRCVPAPAGLLIAPEPEWLIAFERRFAPADDLTRSLERFRGLPPRADALSLFCEGLRLLEQPERTRIAPYIQKTRQLAALCLREGGGGCYACARIASDFSI